VIDLSSEEVLSLSEAARALPSVHGRRIHPSTLWRWARKGLKGVRLDYARLGRSIVTTRRALSDFAARLAAADTAPGTSPTLPQRSARRPRSDAQRSQDVAKADARLRQAGA
jgi:hypothetical protein